MLNINPEIFNGVIEEAKQKTGGDSRWISAIDRAVKMLDGNPYVEVLPDGLLVMSDTSFNTYRANGTCQCRAFVEFKQPCKHRALNRLIQLYNKAVAAAASIQAAITAAPREVSEGEASRVERPTVHIPAITSRMENGHLVETVRGIRL